MEECCYCSRLSVHLRRFHLQLKKILKPFCPCDSNILWAAGCVFLLKLVFTGVLYLVLFHWLLIRWTHSSHLVSGFARTYTNLWQEKHEQTLLQELWSGKQVLNLKPLAMIFFLENRARLLKEPGEKSASGSHSQVAAFNWGWVSSGLFSCSFFSALLTLWFLCSLPSC
jgi:hypothetical protein